MRIEAKRLGREMKTAAVWGKGWSLLAESTEAWSHLDDTLTLPLSSAGAELVAREGFGDEPMFVTVHFDGETHRRTGFVNEVKVLKTEDGVKQLKLHYIRDTQPVLEWTTG